MRRDTRTPEQKQTDLEIAAALQKAGLEDFGTGNLLLLDMDRVWIICTWFMRASNLYYLDAVSRSTIMPKDDTQEWYKRYRADIEKNAIFTRNGCITLFLLCGFLILGSIIAGLKIARLF